MTTEHLPGCDDDGWDHPDECIVEWPTTYDDGEVVGAGLRSELVGDDDLLLTTPDGAEHRLNRVQVAFLKAAARAYEVHNGPARESTPCAPQAPLCARCRGEGLVVEAGSYPPDVSYEPCPICQPGEAWEP